MKKKLFHITKELSCKLLVKLEPIIGLQPPMVTILTYHSISRDGTIIDVTPEEFKFQLKYLKAKFNFVTLDEVVNYIDGKIILKKPSVALTFDDGYRDVMKTVIPLLNKYDIRATFFVISNPKEANRNELRNSKKLLTFDEVKKLQKLGWTIGSHTITHTNLLESNKKELEREINHSKKALEKYLKIPIKYFAYPKGFYNMKTMDEVRKSHYKAAFTMDEKLITNNTNVYAIPRLGVDRTRTHAQFMALFTHSVFRYFMIKQVAIKYVYNEIEDIRQFIKYLKSLIGEVTSYNKTNFGIKI